MNLNLCTLTLGQSSEALIH